VTAADASIEQNASTNVTATFVDSNDRVVPRTQSVQVSTNLGDFDDTQKTTAFDDAGDAVATYTFNAPEDEGGEASITALGGGLTGSTTVTVAEATEPGMIGLENVSLEPDTVDANSTTDHTLTFDATNVSDDGDTDTFTVTLPENTLESASVDTVTDAADETVAVEGEDVSGDTVSIDVAPDSNADTRDLTVALNVTTTAPDVNETTTANVTIDATDSNNGEANATAMLTIEPVDDGDRTAEDYQIDGEYTSQSVFTAIDDWRNDDIEPTVVFGVIDGWRNDG
jgi:hypothetical protein